MKASFILLAILLSLLMLLNFCHAAAEENVAELHLGQGGGGGGGGGAAKNGEEDEEEKFKFLHHHKPFFKKPLKPIPLKHPILKKPIHVHPILKKPFNPPVFHSHP
ncbi:hypothetical protein SDJN02_25638 [Cucurbita argyrosperma subsp. argyrosperma]|nr:hypothetical protein SDJN02_25638 [Cucurbita argyrosperma subsp. argyrosperma]